MTGKRQAVISQRVNRDYTCRLFCCLSFYLPVAFSRIFTFRMFCFLENNFFLLYLLLRDFIGVVYSGISRGPEFNDWLEKSSDTLNADKSYRNRDQIRSNRIPDDENISDVFDFRIFVMIFSQRFPNIHTYLYVNRIILCESKKTTCFYRTNVIRFRNVLCIFKIVFSIKYFLEYNRISTFP